MNRSVPIEANGIIPVAPVDVAGIPPIALGIPDFEGEAILRIFANSTQSEIGCYSTVMTNGATFSHPEAVGSILGIFTVVAIVASFATAVYGDHIPTMRSHYAHSLSVFVVFSVFQHIFFTGTLSLNWPSVLAAFWSNYAWAGGMIYTENMQNSINQFLGSNRGNTSSVGDAATIGNSLGGGYSLRGIYSRSLMSIFRRETAVDSPIRIASRSLESALSKRSLINKTDGYDWYGTPVKPGMPLPGNWSGFGGVLSEESIPSSNAFMTGLLWFLVVLSIVIVSVVAFKVALEALSRFKFIRSDRLTYFRSHWRGYILLAVLRTCLIGFFMMMLLSTYQLSSKGSAGVTAVAVIVFLAFFVSMIGMAGYACFYRLRFGHYQSDPDRLNFEGKKLLKHLPWFSVSRESQHVEKQGDKTFVASLPWFRIYYVDHDPSRMTVHEDEIYIKKFGWLAARFRRTRWWFFALWIVYEFVRACLYGGAIGHPMIQVFGLLIVEIIALIFTIKMKPFEGARLNAIMVYLLGFSKVTTTALSAAFDVRFNIGRITTTAIGIVIIVIQSVLTIALMVAIAVGAISSYMSITRNRTEFKPEKLVKARGKYLTHVAQAAADLPPPPPAAPAAPVEPYFNVSSVRRCPKIEDEDPDLVSELGNPNASKLSFHPGSARASRSNSIGGNSMMSYTTVPWGGRVHRASWSSRDFSNNPFSDRPESDHLRHSSQHNSATPLAPMGLEASTSGTGLSQVVNSSRVSSPRPGSRARRDEKTGASSPSPPSLIESEEQRLGTAR